MRLPIQSSGVSRSTYVSRRAKGITPQVCGSIIAPPAELSSASHLVEVGSPFIGPVIGVPIRCCRYSQRLHRVVCSSDVQLPGEQCECFFPPPSSLIDIPLVLCRPTPLAPVGLLSG